METSCNRASRPDAFAICFAVFGSVSAMMPILKENLDLNPVQVSIALAIPVLLGSVGRIPLGVLSDRYGGRLVFALVMAVSAGPRSTHGRCGKLHGVDCVRLLHRHCSRELLSRHRICKWLVSTRKTGDGAWSLWRRQRWSIARRIRLSGAGRHTRGKVGVLDVRTIAACMAGCLGLCRAESAPPRSRKRFRAST